MNRLYQSDAFAAAPIALAPGGAGSRNAPSVPDHRLFGLVAAGAYGEVWLGCNAVGTLRAVKIVRLDQHASAESFEREFTGLQKFEPVSRSHDGLVDILTLGLLPDEEGFYYVMELADDLAASAYASSDLQPQGSGRQAYQPRTMRAILKSRGALPAAEVVTLGLKLASALSHLHGQGLVHRDVKPSNILFVRGEPKLADAGLVTAADEARSLVGTAGYIAPEGPGTPQADLYALGKVLYEAAFGKDRQEFPAISADLPTHRDHALLLELNAIILKACANAPSGRYDSAEHLRADLELLHAGRSVIGRQRLRRAWVLGTKILMAAGALAIAGSILNSVFVRAPLLSNVRVSPDARANQEYNRGLDELHLFLNAPAAIQHFKQAIRWDPDFADAYAQLAEAWYSIPGEDNSRKGQEAAEMAVKLGPQSGLAHAAYAAAKVFALDFTAAAREGKLAVELSPDSEQVLLIAALSSAAIGRSADALAYLNKVMDPRRHSASQLRVIYAGFVYGWCRQYDRAIELYNATPWLKDGVDSPHFVESRFHLAKGDYINSMRLERQSALEQGRDRKQVATHFELLENAFEQRGPQGYWERRLEFETSKSGELDWTRLAEIYSHLNQPDKAIASLRTAKAKTPAHFAIEIYTNSSFDKLRGNSQFTQLLAELWQKK